MSIFNIFDPITVWAAGIWPIIGHYTMAISLIGLFVAAFLFSSALVAEVPILKPLLGMIRKWSLVAAVVCAAGLAAYAYGVSNGETRKQAQWDAAEQVAIKRAKAARSAAERSVGKSADPAGLRDDPYNRDH